MSDRPATERELLRWAEALSSTAMTGLGFTDNLYERERFEEVLEIAADIRSHVVGGLDPQRQPGAGRALHPVERQNQPRIRLRPAVMDRQHAKGSVIPLQPRLCRFSRTKPRIPQK